MWSASTPARSSRSTRSPCETGLRVNKVTRLGDDIALNLKVPSVRIVAPIPGKNTVGIEVPNEQRADVRLKEVLLASAKKVAKTKIPLFLGKDTEGRPLVYDLADMPHLLIAGTTGTGKSVCLNAIILSILMTRRPDEVKMIMIDPKGGVEMEEYGKIPHLMHPVVTDMKKAEAILAWAVDKMEERYDLLSRARVRNIAGYNELKPDEILRRVNPTDDEERKHIPEKMPYIVIVVDEMVGPDVADEKGGRRPHHPPGPEIAGGRHSPGGGHAEADGRCHHRTHQVEPAGAHLLQGVEQVRQPGRARRDGRRQVAGQGRHAVLAAGHQRSGSRARAPTPATRRSRTWSAAWSASRATRRS